MSVAHLIVGVSCVGMALLMLRRPGGVSRIGGLVMTIVAVPYFASGFGVWKGRFWAWVTGVVMNVAVTLIYVADAIDAHFVAWDEAAVAAVFPVLLLVLLLPSAWRWCRRRSGLQGRAAGIAD